MVRALHIFSVFVIISAVSLIVLLVVQQLQGANGIEQNSKLNIIEKFNNVSVTCEKESQKTLNPLVEQAGIFALYLNPPKPEQQRTRAASVQQQRTIKATNQKVATESRKITAAKSTKLEPKFTLIGISYYRSNPDKSMALVSEPGKGIHWVQKGSNLGHFIVEKIERGMIIYRDGDLLRQMTVDTKTPASTKQAGQTGLSTEQKSPS